jgi:cytochrome c-type biogenesis protein CcmE
VLASPPDLDGEESSMGKGAQMAIATLSVFVAVAWIVSSSEGTFQYFQHVDELLVELRNTPESERRGDIRVHGYVVHGSIRKDMVQGKVWFTIEDKIVNGKAVIGDEARAAEAQIAIRAAGAAPIERTEPDAPARDPARLPVVYDGIDLPDLFTDGAEVVVQGGLEGDTFVARRVTAKCPSKYESSPELPYGSPGGSPEGSPENAGESTAGVPQAGAPEAMLLRTEPAAGVR